jgi:hypothetical protein
MLNNSKNVLLIRSEVGKAKAGSRNVPPPEHVYGYKLKADSESAGSIMSSWQIHKPTRNYYYQKDYRKLNKLGASNHITKPKQVKDFREHYDCIVRKPKSCSFSKPFKAPSDTLIFGIANRPSTPMDKVMNYEYANEAALNTHKVYLDIKSTKNKGSKQSDRVVRSMSTAVSKRKHQFSFKF